MSEKIEEQEQLPFDGIKQIDKEGSEFWSARDLQVALQYKQWRNFIKVIDRAMLAYKNSDFNIGDHFAGLSKMVRKIILQGGKFYEKTNYNFSKRCSYCRRIFTFNKKFKF